MNSLKTLRESFTKSQIENLRRQWATVKTVNPTGEKYKALVKWINDKEFDMVDQLARAKINFVSYIAKKALMDKWGFKLDTIKKMYGGLLTMGEDAPANAVGDGSNVALPPTHEPGVTKAQGDSYKKKNKKNGFKDFIKKFLKQATVNEMTSKEISLQVSNDGDLYSKQIQPIIKNLARKKNKGIFNKNLAVKLFRYAVDNKVKEVEGPRSRMVPGSVRDDAATKLLSQFSDEIDDYVKELKKSGRKM